MTNLFHRLQRPAHSHTAQFFRKLQSPEAASLRALLLPLFSRQGRKFVAVTVKLWVHVQGGSAAASHSISMITELCSNDPDGNFSLVWAVICVPLPMNDFVICPPPSQRPTEPLNSALT